MPAPLYISSVLISSMAGAVGEIKVSILLHPDEFEPDVKLIGRYFESHLLTWPMAGGARYRIVTSSL